MSKGIPVNTTKFSVMDASKTFKKSRTTIYEAIKTGELSRDNDGLIDLSELIRIYGNPQGVQFSTRTEHVQSEIESVLKEQISLLKNQLDLANQREENLMQHIESLTHRIEFKGEIKPSTAAEKIEESIPPNPVEITTDPWSQEQAPISAPRPDHPVTKIEPAPAKKRGLFGRVVSAVLNTD